MRVPRVEVGAQTAAPYGYACSTRVDGSVRKLPLSRTIAPGGARGRPTLVSRLPTLGDSRIERTSPYTTLFVLQSPSLELDSE